MSEQLWEQIAARKRKALAEQIPLEYRIPQHLLPSDDQLDVTSFPKESGWFSERELEITESSVAQIAKNIASKAWSSEEVTRAFCKRAAAAQQLVWTQDLCDRLLKLRVGLDELFVGLLPHRGYQHREVSRRTFAQDWQACRSSSWRSCLSER